jgi:hypothetical protein
MKLKYTLLASALLSVTTLSVNAATELTPEQASALKPYDRVVITGRFNSIGDAVKAASSRADKEGAASFYVVDTSDYGESGNQRVTTDLYKADAPKADAPKLRVINGVTELPKTRLLSWNRSIPLRYRVSIAPAGSKRCHHQSRESERGCLFLYRASG